MLLFGAEGFATLAFCRVVLSNVPTADPVDRDFSIQAGEQTSHTGEPHDLSSNKPLSYPAAIWQTR